jgi:DNA-binding protein HU-beta
MSLNKAQLVDVVAKESGLKKTDVEVCLKGIIEAISAELENGGDVTLIGFGTFKVAERQARTGRSPKDGKQIEIPAKKTAKFKAGKQLSDRVDSKK